MLAGAVGVALEDAGGHDVDEAPVGVARVRVHGAVGPGRRALDGQLPARALLLVLGNSVRSQKSSSAQWNKLKDQGC